MSTAPAPTQAGADERFARAARRFRAFFQELGERFLERDDVLRQIALGLLAKEHVLLTGPPGTAKSQLASAVFGRILDESSGAPSLFSRQITESTVQTDLVGPIDFKNLMATGRTTHFTDEGILGAAHAFLDEIFDGRDMLLRSTLNVLHERELKQGRDIQKGQTECALMTSNRYIADVLESSQGILLAFVDRVTFLSFVPRGFARPEHAAELLRRVVAGTRPPPLDALLTIQDLDVLQEAVDDVWISPELCDGLADLVARLDRELADAVRDDPEFRPTRYLSMRTTVRCGRVLRAAVVLDAITRSEGRTREATRADLAALRHTLVLNGPTPEEAEQLFEREVDPTERRQLRILRTERQAFERCLGKVAVPRLSPRPRTAASTSAAPTSSLSSTSTSTSSTTSSSTTPSAPSRASTTPPAAVLEALPDVPAPSPLAAEHARLRDAEARHDLAQLSRLIAEVAPAARQGSPHATEARALVARASESVARIALEESLEAQGEALSSPSAAAAELVRLAASIDDDTASLHGLVRGLRAQALSLVEHAATFVGLQKLDVEAVLFHPPHVFARADARLAALEELAALRARVLAAEPRLSTSPGLAERWRAALARAEDDLAALLPAGFAASMEQALGASDAGLSEVLVALEPELVRLAGLEARLGAMGLEAPRLRARVAGERLARVVGVAFSKMTARSRDEVVLGVERLVGLLASSRLEGAVPVRTWLALTSELLATTAKPKKKRRRDAPLPGLEGYRALRKDEARVPVAVTLADVALRVGALRALPAAAVEPLEVLEPHAPHAPHGERDGLLGLEAGRGPGEHELRVVGALVAELDEATRREMAELDLSRIERAIAHLEAWWAGLSEGPRDGAHLELLARSGFFDVAWDEAALARFALEAKLVGEVFPLVEPEVRALSERVRALDRGTRELALELLRGRADAALPTRSG